MKLRHLTQNNNKLPNTMNGQMNGGPAAGQQQPQPGAGQSLTPTDLATAVALALKQAMPQQQAPQPQQRQYSQEEIDQMLETYNPDMQLVEALFGQAASPETRLQALTQMVRSVVANSTGHAKAVTENYLRRYHANVADQLEDARFASNEHFFGKVYEGHEGLKQFDSLLRQTLPQYEQAPDYPSDRIERAKYVREKFLPIVKQFQPEFDPTRPPQQQMQAQHRNGFGQTQPFTGTQAPNRGAGLPSLGGGGSGATVGAAKDNSDRPAWDTGHGF